MSERKPKNCTHIIWQEFGKQVICCTCRKILTTEEIQNDGGGRIDTATDRVWKPRGLK